jgi:hypothetical protein
VSREEIDAAFPHLAATGYAITSPATFGYNCIAFAAGDDQSWWWPDPMDSAFWPQAAPREETIDAFVQLFRLLGYEPCSESDFRDGYEKVAIYARGGVAHPRRADGS